MARKSIEHERATSSIWMRAKVPSYEAELPEGVRCDVCVIGAGIAGLTTAYLLAREGRRVVVLDDGPIGGGETGRTSAHLASVQDDRFVHLESKHSRNAVRLLTESHQAAVAFIEATCATEGIACGFRRVDGYLFNAPDRSAKALEREHRAAKRAGLVDADIVERAPLPGFDTGPAIRFPRQAQFHPLAYVRGLARAVERCGGLVYEGFHVEAIDDGAPAIVKIAGGRSVSADHVVVATNAPIVSPVAIPMKQSAYRTYVVGLSIPRGEVPMGLYWDTEDPYHYVRLADDDGPEDTLIVGGEDHLTGQAHDAERRYADLERWARERFPSAGAVTARWSGQVMEPADGVAFIGRAPGRRSNVFLITGDSGQGLTHGTLGGMLVTDLVAGRENPWEKIYDPSRRPLRSALELARHNLNVGMQYLDWLRSGDAASVSQIAPGTGAIIRRGAKLLAVYRDAQGTCIARSAVCTHMGGIVSFNEAEKSWDCPCHGSRFDVDGRVVNGPAARDLAPAEIDLGVAGEPGFVAPRPVNR